MLSNIGYEHSSPIEGYPLWYVEFLQQGLDVSCFNLEVSFKIPNSCSSEADETNRTYFPC